MSPACMLDGTESPSLESKFKSANPASFPLAGPVVIDPRLVSELSVAFMYITVNEVLLA